MFKNLSHIPRSMILTWFCLGLITLMGCPETDDGTDGGREEPLDDDVSEDAEQVEDDILDLSDDDDVGEFRLPTVNAAGDYVPGDTPRSASQFADYIETAYQISETNCRDRIAVFDDDVEIEFETVIDNVDPNRFNVYYYTVFQLEDTNLDVEEYIDCIDTIGACGDSTCGLHNLNGTRSAGDSCERLSIYVSNCDAMSTCTAEEDTTCGTCTANLGEGESCIDTEVRCQSGLTCIYDFQGEETTATCETQEPQEEPEERVLGGLGDPCIFSSDCDLAQGLVCDEFDTETCIKPYLVDAGEECDATTRSGHQYIDGPRLCRADHDCDWRQNPFVCIPIPTESGEECTRYCGEGLLCKDFTCQPIASEGESCDETICASGTACYGETLLTTDNRTCQDESAVRELVDNEYAQCTE